jgi:hypothetical protein
LEAACVEVDALEMTNFNTKPLKYCWPLVAGIDPLFKDHPLMIATTRGLRGLQIRHLFQHQASPDYSDSACVVNAARAYTWKPCTYSQTPSLAFDNAIASTLSGRKGWLTWLAPRGLEVV